jgi:phenylalanyl-tRNA synthetase beta chain
MKVSELWLREWVDPPVDAVAIAAKLNGAGIEAEAAPLLARAPSGVVAALIVDVQPHPQADRLRVCRVDAGGGAPLSIVCGAANARAGIVVPAALPGARLPAGTEIRKAALRGVESDGMLCSAAELGLAEKSEGLLELDRDAPLGTPIEDYLRLNDALITLELTPNRGDCLGIAGVAREVGALFGLPVRILDQPQQQNGKTHTDVGAGPRSPEVHIDDAQGCSHYVGRAIEGLDAAARTPDWMRERLRRGGIRAIHPVVDITNYVMLELGQPLHGFDLARLHGAIRVRRARAGETLALLNEQTIELHPDDLVIADDSAPLVLAGIMGGTGSGVTEATTSIFLEAACFDPVAVAHSGRRHKLLSDSRYRNERGVDPALQRRALERATALVLQICGGRAGPVTEAGNGTPATVEVRLRHRRVEQLLGCAIPATEVPVLLSRLGIATRPAGATEWMATVPSWRYDLRIEADLVEEVGRLYGYDKIPPRSYSAALPGFAEAEAAGDRLGLRDLLVARGYQEVITYSFVDPQLQQRLDPDSAGAAIALDNPIAETMSTMRTSLWSGLLQTWLYNRQRQTPRARLFELGSCYARSGPDGSSESVRLGGLLAGTAAAEQWGQPSRAVDFYDAKADIEALVAAAPASVRWVAERHPALHPGQSARLYAGERPVGWLGTLHPSIAAAYDLQEPVQLFEIEATAVQTRRLPSPHTLSEFPAARRDQAFILADHVSADAVLAVAREAGGALLKLASIFDVYRGSGIPDGSKSIALSLIFQDASRTLTVEEIDAAAAGIAAAVSARLGGFIRGS